MSREEIFKKLNEVFCDVFDDPDIRVNDSTTAADVYKRQLYEPQGLRILRSRSGARKRGLPRSGSVEPHGADQHCKLRPLRSGPLDC